MTTATAQKWTSTAGPRQTNAISKAQSALSWKAKSWTELTDHGPAQLTSPFGEPCEGYAETVQAIGERFGWTITRDNHKDVLKAYEDATAALQIPTVDKRTTADERAERERKMKELDDKRAEESSKHAAEVSRITAELRDKYPWAKPADKLSTHARAAANLREELRRTFPGITFRVRSDSFSMGNSVDVGWTMGPTSREVEAVSGKYQYGHFDGMQDMYCNDQSAYGDAVDIVLGRSKYVQEQRNIPEDVITLVSEGLCDRQRITYDGPHTRNLYGEGDYSKTVREHAWQLLAKTSFPAGAVVTGVSEWIDGEGYTVAFTAPQPATTPQENHEPTGAACQIQKHHHTKRGVDFWLVVLSDRVEREDFERLRSSCKSAGGWYSRKWGTTPGGFAFETEEAAKEWAATL